MASHNLQDEENSPVKKGQFKLPRTQEVRSNANINNIIPLATPKDLGMSVISSGIGTVEVGHTNDDRESREFTEAEENVMRPINMMQLELNTNSNPEHQSQPRKKSQDVLLLITEDNDQRETPAQSKLNMALDEKL